MGKRFAIVIGVAAAGVMALGAQTATAGEPVDSTPPDLQLSGKTRQSVRDAVIVKASCGHEACTASAVGKLTNLYPVGTSHEDKPGTKLKPTSADLLGGCTDRCGKNKTTLGLGLSPSTRKKARKALADGENVQAKVTVRAKDAAGNVATAKRTVKLVK